jgi:hypothetical protein
MTMNSNSVAGLVDTASKTWWFLSFHKSQHTSSTSELTPPEILLQQQSGSQSPCHQPPGHRSTPVLQKEYPNIGTHDTVFCGCKHKTEAGDLKFLNLDHTKHSHHSLAVHGTFFILPSRICHGSPSRAFISESSFCSVV